MSAQPYVPVVIITGGASGIGQSGVYEFAKYGYKIVIADRSVKLGEDLAAKLQSSGVEASFVELDVANEESVKKTVEFTIQKYGYITCAVHAAGIGGPTIPAHTVPKETFQQVMDIDLNGTFYFAKALTTYWLTQEPRMVREADEDLGLEAVYERGSLVCVISINGTLASRNMGAYVAAKHGALGLVKNFAYEYVEQGIRVNAVSPGCTLTPIMTNVPNFDFNIVKDIYLKNQAMQRFASPDEIAPALHFLCSDEASFITGSDMKLDAGWSAH